MKEVSPSIKAHFADDLTQYFERDPTPVKVISDHS